MKRSNIIDLSAHFEEFRENRLKWTVLGKKFFTFKHYARCQEYTYRIRVFKNVTTRALVVFKPQ